MSLKTMQSLVVLAFVTVAAAGCATDPDATRADGGAPVCKRNTPLGSNLPTTTCVTPETAAEQKRQFDQNSLRLPIPVPKSAGGG